jgi:hypothetical protein
MYIMNKLVEDYTPSNRWECCRNMSPSGWWERRKRMFNGGMHTFVPGCLLTVVKSAQRAHTLERPLERVLEHLFDAM